MIHNARVSLISVAVSKATGPYTSPAPTTDEVSCMAIAAHVPNCVWLISSICPMGGNMNSAIAFNMNITPKDTAISSLSAFSTGPTAAMALPPHIAVPDAIRYEVFLFICIQ